MPVLPALHKPKRLNNLRRKRALPTHKGTWRAIREWQLQREPLCRHCCDEGEITPASEVDHIDGDANNNNPKNYQSLCKPCHSRKTLAEVLTKQPAKVGNTLWLPSLPPPSIPVTVVCGCSGAGKSRYVNNTKNSNDIVIDLDRIKAELNLDAAMHPNDRSILVAALKERNKRLVALSNAALQQSTKHAYLIVTAPLPSERRHWKVQLRARVVVLETSPNEAERRIRRDPFRPNAELQVSWVQSWWRRYASDPSVDDLVIRR